MAERVPRIRRAPLPADALIVVRGLSGFYARSDSDVDDLAGDQLERFPLLRLYRPAVLEAAGFQIVPTFRTPHVTIAFDGDLEVWLERLHVADHDERNNRYHES